MMTWCRSRCVWGSWTTSGRSRRSRIRCASRPWPRSARRLGGRSGEDHRAVAAAGQLPPEGARAGGTDRSERRATQGQLRRAAARVVASTFVVSPRLAWGGEDRDRALRDQVSLEQLVALGERLQRRTQANSLTAPVRRRTGRERARRRRSTFSRRGGAERVMTEYLAMLGPLLKKHGAKPRKAAPDRWGEVSCRGRRLSGSHLSPDHTEAQ